MTTRTVARSDQPLTDQFGRTMTSLRVSITDRCDLRCTYCMPAAGLQWIAGERLMQLPEIEQLVTIFATLGIDKVRVTGGEPLVRKDVVEIVNALNQIDGIDQIGLTTNGTLLERFAPQLADAGVTSLNVSLDSLVPHRFFAMTRRQTLDRVLAGLAAARACPELVPIKVNVLAMRGFTEPEILDFAALARQEPYIVRFIEFMPLDADQEWSPERVLTGAEVRSVIEEHYPLTPLDANPSSTSVRYAFTDGAGELGFVNPVSAPFCNHCDRLRLTADGKLRSCLFADRETDLLGPLRAGADSDEITSLIREAVWTKQPGHMIGLESFTPAGRSMSQIGG